MAVIRPEDFRLLRAFHKQVYLGIQAHILLIVLPAVFFSPLSWTPAGVSLPIIAPPDPWMCDDIAYCAKPETTPSWKKAWHRLHNSGNYCSPPGHHLEAYAQTRTHIKFCQASLRHGPRPVHAYAPCRSAPGTAEEHSNHLHHPFGHTPPSLQEPLMTSQAIILSTEARGHQEAGRAA